MVAFLALDYVLDALVMVMPRREKGARVFDFPRSETIMPVIAERGATWSAGVFPAAGRAGRGGDRAMNNAA